ncbi:hypothetical protein T459_32829 [Capsicum annuum]|uniref:Ubiquitin-like protease family profile domain-containing protein n=1 Tax=Capsicum annuum TaxID=4072 RepID=A0A2G2Y0T2_CAPAN|nr:putative protein EIN4-like [Capsicum annuum]PHT63319.1 hypothetical protein T459_32829 [Capsicum annuum]
MKLFGATTITRKIILEGGLVAVDDGSGSDSGSGSGVAVGANDAPPTVFETTSHYDYDHTGCTDFSPDFTISSECFACKCQDCKVNITVEATAEVYNITVDNPLTASKEEEKVEPVSSGERKNYPFEGFNISDEAPKKLIQLINKYCQQQPKVSRNEEFLINIIKGFIISAGLPWHLIDKVYIPINYGNEFHWVLVVLILNERRIQVYDSMSRRRHSGQSFEIQKLAKILPTYLNMSSFLDQKVRTDWSMIEAYRYKMGNPFDVQYVEGIAQQTIGSLDCSLFVAVYVEYFSNGLQVPNHGLDAGLLHKIYASLLWKYGETKAQKPYASDIKDPQ